MSLIEMDLGLGLGSGLGLARCCHIGVFPHYIDNNYRHAVSALKAGT